LGGFVLTVLYQIPRVTSDLDYISAVPNGASERLELLGGRESALAKKHRVYLQYAGGVCDLPEAYDERLTTLDCGLSNLELKVLDPYDLVLSKLTRNSPKDREDVKAIASKLKLSFHQLVEVCDREMILPNPERDRLTLKLWREYFVD
jgi:hypothetical protein